MARTKQELDAFIEGIMKEGKDTCELVKETLNKGQYKKFLENPEWISHCKRFGVTPEQ